MFQKNINIFKPTKFKSKVKHFRATVRQYINILSWIKSESTFKQDSLLIHLKQQRRALFLGNARWQSHHPKSGTAD